MLEQETKDTLALLEYLFSIEDKKSAKSVLLTFANIYHMSKNNQELQERFTYEK